MYRTNTDLEESILRWFFLRSSERDPVFNGVACRSARFIPFAEWTLFSARSFHVFLGGSGVFFSEDSIICCVSFSISMNSSPKLLS